MLVSPSLVHVEASYAAWPRVEVLVGAPAGKIDAPVVERHGNVADSMRKVESDKTALRSWT